MAESKEKDPPRNEEGSLAGWNCRAALLGREPCLLGVFSGIARMPFWNNLQLGGFEVEAVHLRIVGIILTAIFPRIVIVAYVLIWFFLSRHRED